jgi:hypothetical protein
MAAMPKDYFPSPSDIEPEPAEPLWIRQERARARKAARQDRVIASLLNQGYRVRVISADAFVVEGSSNEQH